MLVLKELFHYSRKIDHLRFIICSFILLCSSFLLFSILFAFHNLFFLFYCVIFLVTFYLSFVILIAFFFLFLYMLTYYFFQILRIMCLIIHNRMMKMMIPNHMLLWDKVLDLFLLVSIFVLLVFSFVLFIILC